MQEIRVKAARQEVARVVVEKENGDIAVFFVSLVQPKDKTITLEVVGRRKHGETEAQAVSDFLPPVV